MISRKALFVSLILAACLVAVVAAVRLSGDGAREQRSDVAQAFDDVFAPGPNYPEASVDVRDWATKKESVESVKESLGVTLLAPTETYGRALKGVYVTERYPDGTPVAEFERTAVLDYGDYRVDVTLVGAEESARAAVEAETGEAALASGLVRKASVRGEPAVMVQMGEHTPRDSRGNPTGTGLQTYANWIRWTHGDVVCSISSRSLSSGELLKVAESLDVR